ncbi:20S-pre-rRNA D-site endonuclease nob1 [Saxophila tyrrhenica]|uniref:20S-pre-rRNA D-site endonuclease NOB1 n=1 Tax=Saxophila tyrrhenica TaxID=1690608 RepID=A0AAV9NTJ4_9PEZI|nr:20S-pre-rRNA D-site endonuclease nob1 [Saxophila tyrrhenica]
MEEPKPIHTLVLDTGSIIKNEPSVSTMLKQSENLITVPEILTEIRDAPTRSRVETTLKPFLTLRSPTPSSVKFVTDFARRTGDLAVLSRPDILIIALAYELECERNDGDWRLRRMPGQKRINGAAPQKEVAEGHGAGGEAQEQNTADEAVTTEKAANGNNALETTAEEPVENVPEGGSADQAEPSNNTDASNVDELKEDLANTNLEAKASPGHDDSTPKVDSAQNSAESQEDSDSDSDSEGWITPSNLKKKQAQDADSSISQTPEPKTMQVGVLTTDFAMQNVILQINLNLLSPQLTRVKHLKTFVLRCHSCFQTTKEMNKQFCPRCGQPSLTRVSCSTNSNGEFKLHLKKNMQWNTRGDRYSIPKPVHGSANGRVKGGGKGGWGNDLMLAEDQKEYQRAANSEKKSKARDLMDEDYLPSILTGDRNRAGGRIRVGAGRNVNAKKR